MTQDIVTFELARLYESQGYYQDALEMYKILDKEESSNQTQSGISRLEMKLAMEPDGGLEQKEEKIAGLLEKWVGLVVLRHRLDKFKLIKSRLI